MSYNSRSPAVKRLMKEAQELAEPTELYYAQPLEDNLFEWHFTIRGPEDSDFQGGIYHGRILLPSEYPMKPPNILLLTPNGRFEIKRKICLSISGYHPESWRPCWSIRTALLAIIGFMPTHGGGAIGSLEFSSEERKKLAKASTEFVCSDCGPTISILLPQTDASIKDREEAKTLAQQIDFQSEKQKTAATTQSPAASSETSPPTPSNPEVTQPSTSTPSLTTPMPSVMPPTGFFPWNFYNFPGMMMGQTGLPQISSQPLTFEQWVVQVKGYRPPGSVDTPPVPEPEPANEVKKEEPKEEAKSEEKKETEESEQKEEEEKTEEGTEEKTEEKVEEIAEEKEELSQDVPEEATSSHLEESVQEVDEWPMLSLFIICLLLIFVLLINRYCMPYVYNIWKKDEL